MNDGSDFTVVEVCAGAGGQSLGLHQAGFQHRLAVELDPTAADTLALNLGAEVLVGDVADRSLWKPEDYKGVTLLAGGVPCPPFSSAGKQLGSSDERDLFAWAIEQVGVMRPRALMLENVRGLAAPRFAAYRQHVLDRLGEFGYVGDWKLVVSADFGVPQLRPRFVLVAMQPEDSSFFHWPDDAVPERTTVGDALFDLISANGWKHAEEWRRLANGIGPTLVGGSKKHGGADLGPTRAKAGWAQLYVDGRGIANEAPGADAPPATVSMPRLTIEMAARIQGWSAESDWNFSGRKTAQYRQIGNAFPPPVARAIGASIASALRHEGPRRDVEAVGVHDPVYRALTQAKGALSMDELIQANNEWSRAEVERKLVSIGRDFELESSVDADGALRYRLGAFRGFVGQDEHARHQYFVEHRNRVS